MCNLYQKKKLSCRDRPTPGVVYDEIRQDNDVIKGIGAFYAKNHIELLGPIGLDVAYDENNIR